MDDGTDRVRNVERLQFADGTVAIDKNGNMISSSFNPIVDPNYATLYAPYYDAVPFGTPTITETDPDGNAVDPAVAVVVGDTLHANVATIQDFDGITSAFNYQWQYVDAVSGDWVDFTGATSADFVVPNILLTQGLGVRVKVSYVDGKTYTEQLFSAPTVAADHLGGQYQHGTDRGRGNAVQRHLEHDRLCWARRSTSSRRSPRSSPTSRPRRTR